MVVLQKKSFLIILHDYDYKINYMNSFTATLTLNIKLQFATSYDLEIQSQKVLFIPYFKIAHQTLAK